MLSCTCDSSRTSDSTFFRQPDWERLGVFCPASATPVGRACGYRHRQRGHEGRVNGLARSDSTRRCRIKFATTCEHFILTDLRGNSGRQVGMWIVVSKHQICGPRDSPAEESRGLQTGEFWPIFFGTAGSIGTNKHGPCIHDCGIVGGRMRHSEADGQNQNDVGRAIHSERSGRTSGGNGHLNLGTPHPDDTINQGYCRTSPTYLKTNLLKWRTLAVSTAVKHNGRGRSQRQPQKDIL